MKQLVLFDFDGVMVDTFDLCYGISREARHDLTEDDYRSWFDGNIYDVLDEKRGQQESAALPSDYFYARYIPRMLEQQILPGVRDVICSLAKRYMLAVVTSTVAGPLEEYFAGNKITDCFAKIYGLEAHRSKVEKFRMVFRDFGATARDSIFVTDTLGDMREATKADVQSIGVTWGFQDHATLARGNPWAVIHAPQELVPAVDKFFSSVTPST